MSQEILGIIGGSGLYQIEELEQVEIQEFETPYGEPSAPYLRGVIKGTPVVFLPRHGVRHTLMPSEINYRANIYGFRQLGVRTLISISAVGSLKEQIRPGDVVLPDQFIDRTRSRPSTFFGDGVVAHVQFGDPVCPRVVGALAGVLQQLGARHQVGGTYVAMEGPAFSTRAESSLYRSWGADVIGMTSLPEAKLAREAEICYATLALSTDYDCWHQSEAQVSVGAVLEVLLRNVSLARAIVVAMAQRFPLAGSCGCQSALQNAILTAVENIPEAAKRRLGVLAGEYFKK